MITILEKNLLQENHQNMYNVIPICEVAKSEKTGINLNTTELQTVSVELRISSSVSLFTP